MCAIVDANVVAEVFNPSRPAAGEKFFHWLNDGKGTLVVGGQLRRELNDASNNFKRWARDALLSGIMRSVNDAKVDVKTKQLVADGSCKSDDQHIIGLAQLGGARLLYSNDKILHQDFKNKNLIDNCREAKSIRPLRGKDFTSGQRGLLRRKDLCGVRQ